jgi:outer membrane protein
MRIAHDRRSHRLSCRRLDALVRGSARYHRDAPHRPFFTHAGRTTHSHVTWFAARRSIAIAPALALVLLAGAAQAKAPPRSRGRAPSGALAQSLADRQASTPPAPRRLTLQQAITLARGESPSALVAAHRYRGAYWQYVTYKADYLPSLDINGEPMVFDRSIVRQTLPDGSDAFVPTSKTRSSATLSLNKTLSLTGATIALQSGIERIEGLEGDREVSYLANPVAVTFLQPLFSYNRHRWANRIEPRRYRESRQAYIEDLEWISTNTIYYYFDLLSAQTALTDALEDQTNSDSLLAAARRRQENGQAPENEVLQAELSNLNAKLRLTRSRVDLEVRQQRLANYLGFSEHATFELVPPTDVPAMEVDIARAQAEARKNRAQSMAFDRQLLEADRGVAEAHSTNGSASLFASFGLSRSATRLEDLYRGPDKDQQAKLSVQMPILDWGRNRARVAVATSNREVVRRQVEQAREDFDRDVFVRVAQFDIQLQQLRVSAIADSIAQRRYQLTSERYLQGHGDFNTVQQAQNERDGARRGYIDALRSYWSAYEDVRRTTLYDFERDRPLTAPDVDF